MKYIVIFLIMVSFVGMSYAVPQLEPSRAFDYSDIILVGKVTSVDILSEPEITKTENTYTERLGVAMYEIEAEKYFKTSSYNQTVTVPGLFTREPHGMSYATQPYKQDQRVLLYLQKNTHGYAGTDLIIRLGDSQVVDEIICKEGKGMQRDICSVNGRNLFVLKNMNLNESAEFANEGTSTQITENDRKRYCDYAVERNLATPLKYGCYDEPIANPQREMNLANPMLSDDLLDCSDDDNHSMCFKNAFDSCTSAMIKQEISTVEGDPVYTNAYITDNCKIHVYFDTREDRYRSLEDRKITQSSCSEIQFKDNRVVFSNCNDLNSFEISSKENDLQTSYSQQWITKIILVGIIIGGTITGIIIAIKLWRK